jgi:cation diffusion facilitator CzcD-associated flavoprotein CzcO
MTSDFDDFPIIVVGAGLYGLTCAQQLAEKLRVPVAIIEARNNLGGNAYSYIEENSGIEVHKYGRMTLSSVSDIPTVNGYSGNWPRGWPITPYWGGATAEATTRWIAQSSPRRNLIFCYYDGVQATQAPLKVSIP